MTEPRERITVSLPASLVRRARHAVAAGEAPDVSAYVASALAACGDREQSRKVLADLFADIGDPGPEHDRWAAGVLGVDQAERQKKGKAAA